MAFQFVAHECPQAALQAFMAEAMRIVKPGGVVVFVDNNPRSKTIQNLPPALFTLMKSTGERDERGRRVEGCGLGGIALARVTAACATAWPGATACHRVSPPPDVPALLTHALCHPLATLPHKTAPKSPGATNTTALTSRRPCGRRGWRMCTRPRRITVTGPCLARGQGRELGCRGGGRGRFGGRRRVTMALVPPPCLMRG